MENIGIALLIYTIVLNGLYYLHNRKINWLFFANLITILVAYVIWMLSPGSSIRLSNMPEWQELSLIEKVFQTLPNVLFFSFYQYKFLVLSLSLILSIFNFTKMKNIMKYSLLPIYMFSIVLIFSQRLLSFFPESSVISMMSDGYSLLNTVFWILYSISLIVNIILIDLDLKEYRFSLVLTMALFSSAPLLMSPVIGYRLIVYTFFYLVLLIIMLINEMQINRPVKIGLSIVLLSATLLFGNQLVKKYNLVDRITQERLAILKDYIEYSDQYKDGIWLPRYPIYTIHGGDIEIDDTYHMTAFKTYFNLPDNETITFYWKDSY